VITTVVTAVIRGPS